MSTRTQIIDAVPEKGVITSRDVMRATGLNSNTVQATLSRLANVEVLSKGGDELCALYSKRPVTLHKRLQRAKWDRNLVL